MDSAQLIGFIVGIVVVLAITALAVLISRKRKVTADRARAADMRAKAKADELSAREHEIKASRVEADARQAELEAERLRDEARGVQEEAASVRAGAREQLRKADETDPDFVDRDEDMDRNRAMDRADAEAPQDAPPAAGQEERRRDDAARERTADFPADTGGQHTDSAGDERPRNP